MTIAQAVIVSRVVELLAAALATTHPDVQVEENRQRPLGSDTERRVVVRKLSSVPMGEPMLGAGADWQTQIRIECYARGTVAQSGQQRADALLLAAHAALQSYPTLGDVAMAVSPPVLDWEDDDLDTTISVALARYTVLHRTKPNSLEAAP